MGKIADWFHTLTHDWILDNSALQPDKYEDHLAQLEGTTLGVKLNAEGECSRKVGRLGLDPCERCGAGWPFVACKTIPNVPRGIGVDLGDPAGDQSVNVVMMSKVGDPSSYKPDIAGVRPGWSIVGEVPAEAGKLIASTTFEGMLFLAFERGGLWCVMDGKLRKVTIDNGEA